MTISMVLVLAVAVVAMLLFASERLPVDLVALLVMATLVLSGVLTPEEGLDGFSHPATITVGAMFVLSAGLFKTGAVNAVAAVLGRLGRYSFWLVAAAMMLTVGAVSAFINNTAAVAIFIPVAISVARDAGVRPAQLLMPLSFASMFGGVCTLIGTSTNILVSSIAQRHGLAPIGMFELSGLGGLFFAAGCAYMLLVGIRLIPGRDDAPRQEELFGDDDYVTEIVLAPTALSVGKRLPDSPLLHDLALRGVEVFRGGTRLRQPAAEIVLQSGDQLKVRCNLENFLRLRERQGIALRQEVKPDPGQETLLLKAVVAPESILDGRSLKQARFRTRYGITALALRHRGRVLRKDLETTTLRAGDLLLLQVERNHLEQVREHGTFVLITPVEQEQFRPRQMLPGLAVVAAVVAAAAFGLMPIAVAALLGGLLMVVLRCLTLEEAYRAVNWQVVFLLAGILSLGTALEKSGAAALLAERLVTLLGPYGPTALVSAFYLVTSLLTELMSNNATAALLAPIAIATAATLGVDARPFLMAITFAASASFMTPVGYQTNTLIYGPGQFRYVDFLRVGTPLNLLFWGLATIFIPRFWPF